ncbi:MAG: hypothetical protein ABIP94_03055 [Planctomycetota bacterium]
MTSTRTSQVDWITPEEAARFRQRLVDEKARRDARAIENRISKLPHVRQNQSRAVMRAVAELLEKAGSALNTKDLAAAMPGRTSHQVGGLVSNFMYRGWLAYADESPPGTPSYSRGYVLGDVVDWQQDTVHQTTRATPQSRQSLPKSDREVALEAEITKLRQGGAS